MNRTLKYILIGLGIVLAFLSVWYFSNVVFYILLSAVFALIGKPIVDLFGMVKIGRVVLPKWLRAFLALASLWAIFITILSLLLPLITSELQKLSNIDTQNVINSLNEPIARIEAFIEKFNFSHTSEFTIENYVNTKLTEVLNASFITGFIGSLAGIVEHLVIAVFSVTFITYFFLRDEKLFSESILVLIPDKYSESFSNAMTSTRKLLVRYFVGIFCQMTGIFTLLTIGCTIVGLDFSLCVLIAFIGATINIIPYIGPLIGATINLLLVIATHLQLNFYNEIIPLLGWVFLVFVITKLIDDFIFQPFIFSSSVKAHPLEIFLVILLAGTLAGIPGMILAIPGYTVLRVFAKEFLNKFKVVKKLTSKI